MRKRTVELAVITSTLPSPWDSPVVTSRGAPTSGRSGRGSHSPPARPLDCSITIRAKARSWGRKPTRKVRFAEIHHFANPRARRLLITADAGGSNGDRSRLWKVVLQGLADDLGLRITVCHFPPGTSKWNQIEHRLFSYLTKNGRGRPLVSRGVIVNLIGPVRTASGLRVKAGLDTNSYPKGIKVSDEGMARVRLQRAEFHGDWNFTILPGSTAQN